MRILLHYSVAAFSFLLTFVGGYYGIETAEITYWIISGMSLLLSICAVTLSSKDVRLLHWLSILLAFIIIVLSWFIHPVSWITFIIGVFSALVLVFTIRILPSVKNFILHAQDGSILMEIRNIEIKENNLVIKGKMMGTMPTVAEMRPEEIWKAISMIPLRVLLGFPKYLLKAWKSKGISNTQTKYRNFGY
jgi:hypothetical protein